LSGIHGVAGKVLSMVLSDLLVVGNAHNPRWGQVGGSLIAVDTLVHNFLVRTGVLKRANAVHPYGPQCYGPAGCAAILAALSEATMRDSTTAPFLSSSPGTSKGRSGLIAQKKAWAFATAGPLTTAIAAKIWIVVSITCAIAWRCAAKLRDRLYFSVVLGLDWVIGI
jgi:hypothetical protein